MAAVTTDMTEKDTFIEQTSGGSGTRGKQTETCDCPDTSSVVGLDEIEKKALWLKTKLKEGPVEGPTSLKTYREDIRQILFKEFNSPISDLEIGVVVRKAFPRHSRKGKYYLGIGTYRYDKYATKTSQTITTDDPKSLMTIQSDGESRESSPVMLKPVKKRAIQAWREAENGQAFAADQMIRDANNQASAPVASVVPSDNLIRPPWQPMLMLPHHLHLPPRAMMFPAGRLPTTIPIPHPVMVTTEPNNNINRTLSPSRPRKRANTDGGDPFQKMGFGSERTAGKKSRKEGAMIELSSSHNGIVAERTNMAAMHIQPIILNFEVPPVKLPLSTSAGNSGPSILSKSEKEESKSEQSSNRVGIRLEKLPLGPHPGEYSAYKRGDASTSSVISTSGDHADSSSVKGGGESSTQSEDMKSSHPFKKPDIDNYRNNVSAGRCFLCQNPIPPNQNKDSSQVESAIFTICMKCKKVAMSGSKSLKPVPKFPFACNPKLAPKTVYVPPPSRPFRPRAPSPSGPPKAVGIRLYPPQVRCKLNSPTGRASAAQSSSASPRSPSQMFVPGSPAPSLPLGSPQPMSPVLAMHSAPPSPRHASDATGTKMKSLSLPPSPSMITQQHPPSPVTTDSKEPDVTKRSQPSASLKVPSPYSPSPASLGNREHSSSERLSLPPGREQDDTTVKALLQLGRPVDRSSLEHEADNTPIPSPTGRPPDRDTLPQLHPTSSIQVPHSPISLTQAAMPSRLPTLPGHIPMIPPNAGLVMGPEGQLLPILPSWPRMSIPPNESQNNVSQSVYPQIPLLMPQPITRESIPTVSVPTLDSVVSGVKSRNVGPVKINSGSNPESLPYDISQPKYRKGFKRSRISDTSDSPIEQSTCKGDPLHDNSKSKQSIVIVGTNCAGSSSVKLNSDAKKAPYQEEGVPREAPEMYGKPFGSFLCRCSGREIVMLQCTDCDFVCNNKFGLELHIAAQRHAESRTKSSMPEVMTRHVNEHDDRDETASQSSIETQSADTDTDAASPLPTMVPRENLWSRGLESSRQSSVQAWQESISHYTPEHSISSETLPRTSRASFITPSTYGSFGTVTENIVPLDLSGRTFHPVPYLPDLSGSPFHMRDKRTDSGEESSPLDLSGHSRSSNMSTTGDAGMQHFLSGRKLDTHRSITAKKTPLTLFPSQPTLSTPSEVLTTTTTGNRKPSQAPVLRTFFDLMRLHNMPIPSTAMTSTTNTSKILQSQFHSKAPVVQTSASPSSPSAPRTRLDSPSNDNSSITNAIPNIVLSSSFATTSNVPRNSVNHTTELSHLPGGLITSPILTHPQSLSYQGGTISIRPTIPIPQMYVSSRTVPVLSPFPLSSPVSAPETAASPSQEQLHLNSLNVRIDSPNFYQHSPSQESPTVQGSPKARQRPNALESHREHYLRKDTSPVRSPRKVHIKIEPPDFLEQSEYIREELHLDEQEQRLKKEAEKQARILEASLHRESASNSDRSGIGRVTWGISSRSLQIRDSLYTYTTADSSRSQQASSSEPLLRTSTDHNSGSSPTVSPGMSRREGSNESLFADKCFESSREACLNSEDNNSTSQQFTSAINSSDSSKMDNSSAIRHSSEEPDAPLALQMKVEK